MGDLVDGAGGQAQRRHQGVQHPVDHENQCGVVAGELRRVPPFVESSVHHGLGKSLDFTVQGHFRWFGA